MALGKILIADDDRNIAELLRLYLEKEGYTTELAADGEEAVAKFNADAPDLVLLDIMMPKLAEEGLTMIVVTHEMAFARDVSSHVVFMADGVICEEGTSEEVFGNPRNPRTQEFLSRFTNR